MALKTMTAPPKLAPPPPLDDLLDEPAASLPELITDPPKLRVLLHANCAIREHDLLLAANVLHIRLDIGHLDHHPPQTEPGAFDLTMALLGDLGYATAPLLMSLRRRDPARPYLVTLLSDDGDQTNLETLPGVWEDQLPQTFDGLVALLNRVDERTATIQKALATADPYLRAWLAPLSRTEPAAN